MKVTTFVSVLRKSVVFLQDCPPGRFIASMHEGTLNKTVPKLGKNAHDIVQCPTGAFVHPDRLPHDGGR